MSDQSKYGQSVANHPEVVKARKELVNSRSEETRFYSDKKLREKYAIKAADNAYAKLEKEGGLEYEVRDSKGNPIRRERLTKEDFRNGYLYDDWDQGSDNSFSTYLDDRFSSGKVNKKKYLERQDKAWKNYRSAVSKATDELLGEHGSIVVKEGALAKHKGYASRTAKNVVEAAADSAGLAKDSDKYKLWGDYSSSKTRINYY